MRASSVRTRTSVRYSRLSSSAGGFGSRDGSNEPSSRITWKRSSAIRRHLPSPEAGLEEELPRAVRGPNERPAGGVQEAHRLRAAAVRVERLRRHVLDDRQVPRARPEVLPEGHDVDVRGAPGPARLRDLVLHLPEAEPNRGLRAHPRLDGPRA